MTGSTDMKENWIVQDSNPPNFFKFLPTSKKSDAAHNDLRY